jgi:hypothetical protein
MISYMSDDTLTTTTPTYADIWADAINETYDDFIEDCLVSDCRMDGEDYDDTIRRVLYKAADALRGGIPATFTGEELDLVRHLMPAHEVHQSGTRRWVLDNYGPRTDAEGLAK